MVAFKQCVGYTLPSLPCYTEIGFCVFLPRAEVGEEVRVGVGVGPVEFKLYESVP